VWLLRLAYLNVDSNVDARANDVAQSRGSRFDIPGDL
jgi:hypothetical protein